MADNRTSPEDGAAVTLPSDHEILVTRTFQAPPALVFEAWTTPEHLRRWYGCPEAPLVVCEIDLREGGAWRYVVRMPDGTEHAFSGTFREVARPHRLVHTQTYENIAGADCEVTVTFEQQGPATRLSQRFVHASRENRDGHLAAGMEEGANEALRRLADLVEKLGKRGVSRGT